MGSDSDWETLQHTVSTLETFDVPCDVLVASAHRTPARAMDYASNAQRRGIKVLIAAAGGAAHLAGVVAAHTHLPVIGIPVKGWALDGLDSLLSTVQMPGGIPVATVAIGKAGAVNAAILSVQILALNDARLRTALRRHQKNMKQKVEQGHQRVAEKRSASS
jgi:5-(carboxyamino)imidazole ribonucleotide mutase